MKLDRRKFIKLGAVSGGALALPNPMKLAEKKRKPWNRQQARTLRKFRNPKPTTCGLCENRCGMISYREGDRIVMLHGNPDHPVNHGKLCARAYGQLDRLYDPDRILTPKLREGERGSGKWRDISWEEAYKVIAEKLAPYIENHGAGIALLQGRKEILSDAFYDLFPEAVAVEGGNDLRIESLRRQLYGVTGCRYDFANSRYILNFAADPYIKGEAMLSGLQALIAGRLDNGTRLVTVTARLNNTAGRSDSWIPVSAADYGTFARALSYHLLKEGLYNKKALAELGLQAAELKGVLKEFAPEKVALQIGVEAATIRDIAETMARYQPALAIYDDELLLAPDGRQSAAAVELLNMLLGAVGQPGGVYYYKDDGLGVFVDAVGSQKNRQRVSLDWFANWLDVGGNRTAVINYAANPAYTTFSGKYPYALWQNEYKIPFHLAIDTHFSETTFFADIILPAATELETFALNDMPLADGRRVLSLRQPVSRLVDEIFLLRQAKAKKLDLFSPRREPVADSRDFNQIVLELQQLVKGNSPDSAPRFSSWLEALVGRAPFANAGIDWHRLQKDGFQVYRHVSDTLRFNPSIMASTFAPLQKRSDILPKDAFTLIPYRWHALDNMTANCKYLAEFRHENFLWIHSDKAAQLGIAEGEDVRVTSQIGSVTIKAWITEAIHPDCVAVSLGLGHTKMGRVAQAKDIAQSDPMTRALLMHNPIHFTPFSFRLRSWDRVEPIWWHEKGNGVDIRRIFKATVDANHTGMTEIDTTVRLQKV